jgi:hypothetical protein
MLVDGRDGHIIAEPQDLRRKRGGGERWTHYIVEQD